MIGTEKDKVFALSFFVFLHVEGKTFTNEGEWDMIQAYGICK